MSRYTLHVVWLLLTVAGISAVHRGPYFGYPIALFLAFIASICIASYPSDNSLRRWLAAFGCLFTTGGLTDLLPHGFTSLTIHGSLPLLLIGLACLWSALIPWTENYPRPRHIEPSPRIYPTNGPPCPKCSRQLRTQNSLQCFNCGADWH